MIQAIIQVNHSVLNGIDTLIVGCHVTKTNKILNLLCVAYMANSSVVVAIL